MAADPTRRVWDLPVRLCHWTLVAAVVGAYVTDRIGVSAFRYHVWCGYTVLVLVVFRVCWGVVGTRHARFIHFVRGPIATWAYLRDTLRGNHHNTVGHNPLGALMVMTLLTALALQAITGLFGNDEIFNVGPLYGYVSDARSLQLTSIHRQLFYWILAAIGLHVGAVLVHRWAYGEDLIGPMFSGRKSAKVVPAEQAIDAPLGPHAPDALSASVPMRTLASWNLAGPAGLALALLIVLAAAGVLAWIVIHAPQPAAIDSFN